MRTRTPAAALIASASIIAVSACGSSASPSAAAALPAAEQQAITSMTAHCTQDAAQLASMVAATSQLEVKAGITGESVTALAQHLATVVAAYGSKKVSCVDPFASYLTLREGGS